MNEELLIPVKEIAVAAEYPCLIPAFQIRNNALYFGEDLIKKLELQELLFLSCCDGEIDYESIQSFIPEANDFRNYFTSFLIDLPKKEKPKATSEEKSKTLVISPHGYEGYTSIGSAIEDWSASGVTVEYLTCFSEQVTTRKGLDFGSSIALNMLRKDETKLCARLSGTINHQLNIPDHKYAQAYLFQDDFAKQYKKVASVLRQQLFKKISTIKPDRIYFPAGLANNRDGALIFELLLDFYKKSIFESTTFFIYTDFPFSVHYSAIDELRLVLDEYFVNWEECFDKTKNLKHINSECYRVFRSLYKPSDKKLIDSLTRRNAILAGAKEDIELNHFFKLIDKPLNH